MTIRTHEFRDSNGNITELRVMDPDAGTLTVTVDGVPTVSQLAPDIVADMRRADREEAQAARIASNFQALRLTAPAATLTNAQLRDEVDLLRAVLLDLTRIVRGIAAE